MPLRRVRKVAKNLLLAFFLMCGSEALCLTANDEKKLRIWKRKVMRKIFGPICVAGYWRSRTNGEVRQLYGELDIVTEI